MLRGQHLFLLPGDSPVGLRLPLPSLPWVAPSDVPEIHPPDPMVNRAPSAGSAAQCADPRFPRLSTQSRKPTERDRMPELGESAPWVVRTALCVEPRDGRLHIFMPPVDSAEDYVDLLAALEDTAAHLNMPVVIEGYPPPHDARIQTHQGHARPRRDRGERSPGAQLAGAGGQHDGGL